MLTVGFIGAGMVCKGLSGYLNENGFEGIRFASRSLSSAQAAARLVNGIVCTDNNSLADKSDIIFITTTDNAISEAAASITLSNLAGKVIVHCSGALDSSILSDLAARGAGIASLHPIMTFGGEVDLSDTPFIMEGKKSEAAKKLPFNITEIACEQKALYHAALVVMSNYLITLLDYGEDILKTAGLDKQITTALVQQSIANFYEHGAKCITGPISRNDTQTIQKHLNALAKNNINDILYRRLGVETFNLCRQNGRLADGQALFNILTEAGSYEKGDNLNN